MSSEVKVDPNLYVPQEAQILKAEMVSPLEKMFRLKLTSNPLHFEPGQFVQVSLLGIGEAPISIASCPLEKDYFELCVRRAGNVTQCLHQLKEGDTVGIRGPFGHGFPLEKLRGKHLLFIAGGLGIVPLRSFILYALARRNEFLSIKILYGMKAPRERLFSDELVMWEQAPDVQVQLTVDKPDETWPHHVGVITRLLPPLQMDFVNTYALVVGPPVMYKYVIMELKAKHIPEEQILLSLERRMRCGVGKCGHCQVNNLYVCRDGPKFSYQELKNLVEAL